MVARRLLILLLVLLGISTLAAALAPVKSPKDTTTTATTGTTTAATTPSAPPAKSPGLFKYTINADSGGAKVVELYVGEELQLTVTSKHLDQVALPELGQVQPVSRYAAAKFDLYLDQPGDYAVRLVGANRLVGRLRVNPGARPGRGRGKASGHRGQR
jgi:hypothetical protein